MEVYGDFIVDAYNNHQMDQVCVELNFCHKHINMLIGDNPCTYGPSYWCQSAQNAEVCRVSKIFLI